MKLREIKPDVSLPKSEWGLQRGKAVEPLKTEKWTRIELHHRTTGRRLVQKIYTVPPLLRWRTFLTPSRARREYRNLLTVFGDDLPCIEPVGWQEYRRLGCVCKSEVSSVFMDGQSFEHLLRHGGLGKRDRRQVCRAVGDLLWRLHCAGHVWMTAAPRNVIVTGVPNQIGAFACDMPYLLSFDGSALATSHALVDVYSIGSPLPTYERRAFLLAYCSADRSLTREMLRFIENRSVTQQRWAQSWRRSWFGNIKRLFIRLPLVRLIF